MLKQLDANGDGVMDFEEFAGWYRQQPASPSRRRARQQGKHTAAASEAHKPSTQINTPKRVRDMTDAEILAMAVTEVQAMHPGVHGEDEAPLDESDYKACKQLAHAAFAAVDPGGTSFAPKMELVTQLNIVAKIRPSLTSLATEIETNAELILDVDDFKELLEQWQVHLVSTTSANVQNEEAAACVGESERHQVQLVDFEALKQLAKAAFAAADLDNTSFAPRNEIVVNLNDVVTSTPAPALASFVKDVSLLHDMIMDVDDFDELHVLDQWHTTQTLVPPPH